MNQAVPILSFFSPNALYLLQPLQHSAVWYIAVQRLYIQVPAPPPYSFFPFSLSSFRVNAMQWSVDIPKIILDSYSMVWKPNLYMLQSCDYTHDWVDYSYSSSSLSLRERASSSVVVYCLDSIHLVYRWYTSFGVRYFVCHSTITIRVHLDAAFSKLQFIACLATEADSGTNSIFIIPGEKWCMLNESLTKSVIDKSGSSTDIEYSSQKLKIVLWSISTTECKKRLELVWWATMSSVKIVLFHLFVIPPRLHSNIFVCQ